MLVAALSVACATVATARGADEFTFAGGLDGIFVPATYKGHDGWFILHTGERQTTLDLLTFQDLPVVTAKAGDRPADGEALPLCKPPDLDVGPFHLAGRGSVSRVDLSDFNAMSGRTILGVIGCDVLSVGTLQIDFDRHRLRLLPPSAKADATWGPGLPITVRDDGLFTDVVVGGQGSPCVLNTGSGGSIALSAAAFDRAVAAERPTVRSSNGWLAESTVPSQDVFRSHLVRVGTISRPEVLVSRSHGTRSQVGLEFLSQYAVTFDWAGGRLYLKPASRLGHRDVSDMSGMYVSRQFSVTRVGAVIPGGPAESAGIRAGDTILAVDGKAVDQWDLDDLRLRLRSGNGVRVSVRVARAGGGADDRVVTLNERV